MAIGFVKYAALVLSLPYNLLTFVKVPLPISHQYMDLISGRPARLRNMCPGLQLPLCLCLRASSQHSFSCCSRRSIPMRKPKTEKWGHNRNLSAPTTCLRQQWNKLQLLRLKTQKANLQFLSSRGFGAQGTRVVDNRENSNDDNVLQGTSFSHIFCSVVPRGHLYCTILTKVTMYCSFVSKIPLHQIQRRSK